MNSGAPWLPGACPYILTRAILEPTGDIVLDIQVVTLSQVVMCAMGIIETFDHRLSPWSKIPDLVIHVRLVHHSDGDTLSLNAQHQNMPGSFGHCKAPSWPTTFVLISDAR